MKLASYCRIPRSVLSSKSLTPAAKLVYAALSGFTLDEREVSWPSLSQLAAATGLSRRGVQKALAMLEQEGLITVERRKRHDGMEWRDTNGYTLTFPEEHG